MNGTEKKEPRASSREIQRDLEKSPYPIIEI